MRVDFANERFISLEDAGLEESSDLPVFGLVKTWQAESMTLMSAFSWHLFVHGLVL
jgi:hypothetical protein